MDGVFEFLGLSGLQPGLQWLILLWGIACVVSIPVELFFWVALKRTVKHVDLGAVAAPGTPIRPAFYGEDEEKKAEHLAQGDAYEGPDLGREASADVALATVKKTRLGIFRRLVFWLLIPLLAVVGAWLVFGDPFAGTDVGEAIEGKFAGKGGMDVLASLWFMLVVTVGRGAMFFVEQKFRS